MMVCLMKCKIRECFNIFYINIFSLLKVLNLKTFSGETSMILLAVIEYVFLRILNVANSFLHQQDLKLGLTVF